MKSFLLIINIIRFLLLIGCSNNDNPAPALTPSEDNKNLFLSQSEASFLTTNKWCEAITIKYRNNQCNPIRVAHSFTQFSDKEFYGEFFYPAQREIYCGGLYMSKAKVNDLLENASYRVSFTARNLATMTQMSDDNESKDVEFYVDENSVKFIPIDQTLKPGHLTACDTSTE